MIKIFFVFFTKQINFFQTTVQMQNDQILWPLLTKEMFLLN